MPELRKRHAALDAVYRRLDLIAAQCGEQFPLYCLPRANWKLSRRGSWLGGMWTALWWRRAQASGTQEDLQQARDWCRRLEAQLHEPSLNRSFVFAYGAALGSRLHADEDAYALACRAAGALAADYRSDLPGWMLGPGMGGGERGASILDIDALAPTLALLHVPGDASLQAMARSHLQLCVDTLATPSGAWAAHASLNAQGQLQAVAPGTWARGQAWAMLGLAEAVRLYGSAYAQAAERACDYWLQRWGEAACRAMRTPAELDPCAVAIASLAMLRLWQYLPGRSEWREHACRQIAELLHLTLNNGRFCGHYYRTGPDQAQLVESPCALFFLVEALHTQDQVLSAGGGIAGW